MVRRVDPELASRLRGTARAPDGVGPAIRWGSRTPGRPKAVVLLAGALLLCVSPFPSLPFVRSHAAGLEVGVRAWSGTEAALPHPALAPASNGSCSMTALTSRINCTGIGLTSGNTFLAVVDDFQTQDPNVTSSSFVPSSIVWFKNLTHSAGIAGASSSPSMFAMRAQVTSTDATGWVNVSVGVTDFLLVQWWVFSTAVDPVPRLLGNGSQG